jgi:dTDP-4-amino-4,6-dideoxygalactose transaminase
MIKFLDLKRINEKYIQDFKEEFDHFLDSGYYILGDGVKNFEKQYAEYCGVDHCIGVANGLDALTLIFRAYKELGMLKEGDEVIVPANTYIASALAITENNLKPVFVDPNPDTFLIDVEGVEKCITGKTKAILSVHLYGQLVDVSKLRECFGEILIIEDAAQAHGAVNSHGVKAGALGDAAGFSFYPTKNLGALGDGGAVTTDNSQLAEIISMLRNYGSEKKDVFKYKGINSRLDDIQARFLSVKLKDLDKQNKKRREIAGKYIKGINNPKITLPYWDGSDNHVFHQFVIKTEKRDKLRKYLLKNGIETAIHYPLPMFKQAAFKYYKNKNLELSQKLHAKIISLPVHNEYDVISKILFYINNVFIV